MTTRARRFSCHILVVLTAVFTLLASHAQALSWTEQTTPATDQLRDVWAADGANIWVVGNGGRIVKGDGSGNWALQTSGVTNPLIEVWGTSATNLWAVGGSGRILRSTNGTSWATETSGTANTLFSLWGSSATNVWAAGDNSTLTRWNGTSWTASSLGVGTNVLCYGLWGSAANNIWLVGTHINTGNGRVYRYNGTAWSEDTSMGTVAGLNDVWGTSASDVWAVGNGGLILRWNGTAWSPLPSGTTQDLLSIWGSSATDVYATSAEGGIFHYDGTSWTAETSGSIERLNAVIGTSASAVYIAGGSFQVATILAGAPAAVPTAPPTVTTTNPGTIGSTTVVMGGNVTTDGGGPVLERGIVWGTVANPTTADNKFPIGSGMGSFSGTVTGLPPTTTVFARAFARNSLFTGYGAETSFVTLSNNADLSALTTTAGALSPGFAANTTSYTASVPNATTSVTVTPTRAAATSTLQVRVNGGTYATVTSGSASVDLPLNVGGNTINVLVTAQDGSTTKTYTLTVTRAAPVLAGDPITPTAVLTTSQWVGPIAGVRANMIDGRGLSGSGSVFTQTHDNVVTADTMWHAGPNSGDIVGGVTGPPPFGAPPVNTQAVEFDLGANYDLSGAHIWNMNQVGSIGRGVKDVQILVSSATTGAFTALTTAVFTQGTGDVGLAAQVVPLTGATNVRRVRFSIQTAWSGAASDYVGLSEVRFQGTPYTVTPAPTLTSVSPVTGSTAGGTEVVLTGTNFTGATGVTFDGIAATNVSVFDAQNITCITPPHAAGAVSVVVTTPGGSNAANTLFTYAEPNTNLNGLRVVYFGTFTDLFAFSPATTSYSINVNQDFISFAASVQAEFVATQEHKFNTDPYTSFVSGGPFVYRQLNVGANTLLVRVTNGTAQKVYTVNITYTPPAPTLTSVSPATGSTAGGNEVVLTGTNFTGATSVTFDGTAATAFTVDSATQITATTPAHAAGAVSVIVTTPGGSNAANTLFTYGVGNTAPIIRNAFGLELPAALTLDHAENIAFSDTLLVTDANSGQNHTWALSGHDAAKFTVHPTTGAFALANTLDFENHTDHDMNGVYEVTVTVTDSGTPAMSDSIAVSFTIQNDNDAPTVSAIAAQSTNEDTPTTAIAFTVGDQDAGQSLNALVVTVTSSDQTLIPETPENIVRGGSGANRTLTLTPAPNANGTATITVTVSDGTASTTRTFILTVVAVNDAPSFTLAPPIARFPGSGAYTQAGVVSAISPGPADESGQSVTLSLTSVTNTAIFTVQPTLSASGSLSFTPGSTPEVSTVTVRATDSGGAFTEQSFTITISAFKPGADGEVWTGRMTDANRVWQSITSSADGSKLAAVVDNGLIYTSTDSGVTWLERPIGFNFLGDPIPRSWRSITSSADGSKLAAVVSGGQIYTSTNSGVTWTARESNRSWISITSSADGSKLAAVGQNGQIYTSTDSGVTWTARESNRLWLSITSSADGSKLAAVAYNGQIYTSTDSGVTWTAREQNRAWQSITSSADGSKLAAVVGGGFLGQIYTSTDSGVTWTARESNRKWASITSSADGSKLAAVVFNGQIYTSTDSGLTWTARELIRSWWSITSSADGSKLAAVHNGGYISTSEGRGLPEVAAGRALTVANFTTAEASNGVVSYTVTNNNPALFTVQPAIALDGTLTLTAGQAAGNATVTVTVNFAGGTTTPPQTFPIQVIKRRKVQQQILFFLVDAPAEQYRRIAAGETFVGVFRATLFDNPSDLPLVLSGPDAALFQLDPGTGSLDFIAVPSFVGDRVYDVTLSVGSPTSVNGMATARIRITDKEVNVMPSFTKGADLTNLPATVAPQTIPGWATAISDGDAAVTQALTFSFRAISGANLLSVPPAIDPATGNLTFTPSGIAGGTARYAVTLTDDASINGTPALTTAEETFDLTFTAVPPTLAAVTSSMGSTLGGTSVTLTGTGFTGATGVSFGGTPATGVTVVNATTITATTPPRAAGAVSVIVTTPGGSNAANSLYTYAAPGTAPILGVPTASDVTSSRVTLLGTVTYDGGAAVTEQGFIYAPITRSPTPVIGGPGVVQKPSALVAQGMSTSESGLQPGTSYALRSYARNSFGLSYSGVTTNFQTGPLLGRLEVRTDDNSVLADNDGYGFGNAATGATKVRTLNVRNVGTARLTNILALITGANEASFTRSLPSTTLEPGASMNVTVSFLPTALGAATAILTFSSSEVSQPPQRVNLSGNGVAPNAAALSVKVGDTQITDNVGSVDYGNVPLSTSAERVFTLTNTGADNLTGLVLSVIGTHKTDVTLSPLTATVLSAGDSVSFTAYLTPGAVGARSATIQIKSSDSTAQPFFDIPVTATGIVPEIEVLQGTTNIVDNSTTVSFGTTVPVGTNSVRTFTVKNLGTSTLTLGAISFDGLHAADFTATVPGSLSLAQNASTTFDVTFRPSSGGARTAALHLLTSDANESPFDIKLSGTGIGPEISVAAGTVQLASGGPAIDFGEVITDTSSVARTYTLKNLGNAPLTGISVSSDSPRFVVGGTPAATLDAGKTATFTLTFSPNVDGPFTGTVSIVSNDFDEATFTLPVMGKGAANTPPTIAPGPQDQIIALGQPVTFGATVTSPLTFTRQWRRGTATFANITGATAETYRIDAVKLTDAVVKYQLRATNTTGTKLSADSTAAALTVVDRAASSQNLEITKVATFTISAATAPGSTLTYLWKKDGGALPGNASAVGNRLTLTNLVLTNAGTYTCEVTGPGGTLTGGDQVLTVFDQLPVISATAAPSPARSLKAFAAAATSAITLTLPEASVDGYYTYQVPLVDTSRGNASSYKGTGLPPGLNLNLTTGRLSGIPTQAGSYSVTFTARNAIGSSTATGTLTVNPNLGNSVAGSYFGLIERGPLTGGLGGRLDLTIAFTRSISGRLTLGSTAISFAGSFIEGNLSTSITIPRTGLPNLTLTLAVDSANNRFAASGCTLTDGTNTSAFSGWRDVWSTTNAPTTYLGAYNFAMSAPASSPADTIPLGHGYGSFTVSAKGALTSAGRLPDGETFTTSSQLGPNGEVALFSVVTGRSSLHGSTQINPGATNAANTLATGSLTWTRPATTIGATAKTTLYAAGFGPIALTCEGGRYTAPVAPGLLMGKAPGTGNAMLRFYDANIGGPPSPADCAVTLTTTKATVVTTTTLTKFTAITGTTGIFTGSFTLTNNHPFLIGAPVIKRSVTFNGLIVPTASGQRGYGYFLLPQLPVNTFPPPPTPSLSGAVELE